MSQRSPGRSYAVPAIVAAGHDVTALARSPEKAATLTAQGARPIGVSLFDRAALTAAFAGHDAIANLATAIPATNRFVVLRFGWFYGPRATHSEEFLALARRHVIVQLGAPDGFVSSIHVADGGAAVAAALHVPAGTYNVVDDEPLTKRGFGDALAAAARTTPWLRVPGRLAYLLGDRSTSLTRSLRVRNAKFRTASGWAPRYPSAREGWLATAAALAGR